MDKIQKFLEIATGPSLSRINRSGSIPVSSVVVPWMHQHLEFFLNVFWIFLECFGCINLECFGCINLEFFSTCLP